MEKISSGNTLSILESGVQAYENILFPTRDDFPYSEATRIRKTFGNPHCLCPGLADYDTASRREADAEGEVSPYALFDQ